MWGGLVVVLVVSITSSNSSGSYENASRGFGKAHVLSSIWFRCCHFKFIQQGIQWWSAQEWVVKSWRQEASALLFDVDADDEVLDCDPAPAGHPGRKPGKRGRGRGGCGVKRRRKWDLVSCDEELSPSATSSEHGSLFEDPFARSYDALEDCPQVHLPIANLIFRCREKTIEIHCFLPGKCDICGRWMCSGLDTKSGRWIRQAENIRNKLRAKLPDVVHASNFLTLEFVWSGQSQEVGQDPSEWKTVNLSSEFGKHGAQFGNGHWVMYLLNQGNVHVTLGGAGLPMVALCFWGMQLHVSMVALCYWGMPVQIAKRIVSAGLPMVAPCF